MIELIAKAATERAIEDKKSKGANGIEWQLIPSGNVRIDRLLLPIYNVHTRLYSDYDICIDMAYNHYQGIGSHKKEFVQKPENIAVWLTDLFETYTFCNILVENSCVAKKSGRFKNMFFVDTVPTFVEELQRCLDVRYKNRLGTVLDVCHFLSNYRTMSLLIKDDNIKDENSISLGSELDYLSSAFSRFSTTCKTVHFNNSTNLGIRPMYHGTVFKVKNAYEQTLFYHLLNLYKRYTPNSKFVIEVREDDLNNAINFEYMVKQVRIWEESHKLDM